MATRHVVEGEARIAELEASVERRHEVGVDTRLARDLLRTMRITLTIMRDHKALIEAERKAEGK